MDALQIETHDRFDSQKLQCEGCILNEPLAAVGASLWKEALDAVVRLRSLTGDIGKHTFG